MCIQLNIHKIWCCTFINPLYKHFDCILDYMYKNISQSCLKKWSPHTHTIKTITEVADTCIVMCIQLNIHKIWCSTVSVFNPICILDYRSIASTKIQSELTVYRFINTKRCHEVYLYESSETVICIVFTIYMVYLHKAFLISILEHFTCTLTQCLHYNPI